MRFTLRQLQVFVSTAHFESVSLAAQHLSMSQSACSGALKELEQAYDMQLFDRVGKRLVLNAAGRQLWGEAQSLLDRAQDLENTLLAHKETANLKVGATLTIGSYLAVEMLQRFMAETGGIASLAVENTQHIIDSVLNFELDIALIEGEVQHKALDVIPWRGDVLSCFCHPDHPLASKSCITDKDLTDATWILREPGSGTRQTFDRAMHGLLPRLDVLLELQQPEAIKQAVKANLGISCLSEVSLKDSFERGSLVPVTVSKRDFSRQFYIVVHKQKYLSHGIVQWLNLCGVQQHDG